MAGEEGKVRFLGAWASPFAQRVWYALNLKKVEYEFVEECVLYNKSELLLESNPVYKKIPVLLHGDRAVCESMIIVEYIDEVWQNGPSIVPADPFDRATARFWAAYIDDKIFGSFMTMTKAGNSEEAAEAVGQIAAGLVLLEGAFEKCSRGKAFFGGDEIGLLDIALGGFVGWIKAVEKMTGMKLVDEAKTPLLAGWVEQFCSHEAVKGVVPETEDMLEFFKAIQARMRGAPSHSN